MCVFERRVLHQKKSPAFSPSYPRSAVGLKAYFATCMRVFRTELDRGASSGEVTDCVIVSKLNNQYSSTCWDNTIIHLSIVEDCRQRDISHCCLVLKCPTLEFLRQDCSKRILTAWVFFCSIHMGNVKYKMIVCKTEGIERDKVYNRILFWCKVYPRKCYFTNSLNLSGTYIYMCHI